MAPTFTVRSMMTGDVGPAGGVIGDGDGTGAGVGIGAVDAGGVGSVGAVGTIGPIAGGVGLGLAGAGW